MTEPIRIAVPTEGPGGIDAPRSAHFGHAASFTLVDVKDGAIASSAVIMNPPHVQGGCGATVGMLHEIGAGMAIVVGMGGGPRAAMASHGMQALFDGASETPRQAVEAYLAGGLKPFGADRQCAGH
ncbi:MAG TPA: NifB/NifX family molybdenum-iron cluster-binding protein [Coriobacteriia bacterium]